MRTFPVSICVVPGNDVVEVVDRAEGDAVLMPGSRERAAFKAACLMKCDTDSLLLSAASRMVSSSSGVNRTEIMAAKRRLLGFGAACASPHSSGSSLCLW